MCWGHVISFLSIYWTKKVAGRLLCIGPKDYEQNPAVARMRPTILVVIDLEGHPRLMIFMSSKRAFATFY